MYIKTKLPLGNLSLHILLHMNPKKSKNTLLEEKYNISLSSITKDNLMKITSLICDLETLLQVTRE